VTSFTAVGGSVAWARWVGGAVGFGRPLPVRGRRMTRSTAARRHFISGR